MTTLNLSAAREFLARKWDAEIVPRLIEYIHIPCKSPHFDPAWQANGHIDAAVALAHEWCRAQPVAGMRIEVLRLPGRTPVLFFDIPGTTHICPKSAAC